MFAISVPIFVLAGVCGGYGKQLGLEQAGVSGPGAIPDMDGTALFSSAAETPLLMGSKTSRGRTLFMSFPAKIETHDDAGVPFGKSPPTLWGKVTMTFSRKGGFKDWLDKVSRGHFARGSILHPAHRYATA